MDITIESDGTILCDKTQIRVTVSRLREAIRIRFHDDGGNIYLERFANQSSRPISVLEKNNNPTIECQYVIVWKLNGKLENYNILPNVEDANEFVENFLRSYQYADGIGCKINGVPKLALVDVIYS